MESPGEFFKRILEGRESDDPARRVHEEQVADDFIEAHAYDESADEDEHDPPRPYDSRIEGSIPLKRRGRSRLSRLFGSKPFEISWPLSFLNLMPKVWRKLCRAPLQIVIRDHHGRRPGDPWSRDAIRRARLLDAADAIRKEARKKWWRLW